MNKRNLQNEDLDCIARRLLKSARVSDESIESIVAAPNLFDSIKNRIESGKSEPNGYQFSFRSFANQWFPKWQLIPVFLLLFIVGVAFIINSKTGNSSATFSEQAFMPIKQTEEIQPKVTQFLIQNNISKNPPHSLKIIETKSEIRLKHTSLNSMQNSFESKKSLARKSLPKLAASPNQVDSTGKFFALDYTGISADPNAEVKIVRAMLSRSALFALGVNLPLENETEKIKTDLLVGDDGVARAFRFVN